MTAPRTRRWVTNYGAVPDITTQHAVTIVSGPVTVQRVWAQPNAAQVGAVNPRWPRWLWGLHVGATAGSVFNPQADEESWMVHRQVYRWNDQQHPRATDSPRQLVDTEGQRIVPAGEALRLVLGTIEPSQITDFIWHVRALVLDP